LIVENKRHQLVIRRKAASQDTVVTAVPQTKRTKTRVGEGEICLMVVCHCHMLSDNISTSLVSSIQLFNCQTPDIELSEFLTELRMVGKRDQGKSR